MVPSTVNEREAPRAGTRPREAAGSPPAHCRYWGDAGYHSQGKGCSEVRLQQLLVGIERVFKSVSE